MDSSISRSDEGLPDTGGLMQLPPTPLFSPVSFMSLLCYWFERDSSPTRLLSSMRVNSRTEERRKKAGGREKIRMKYGTVTPAIPPSGTLSSYRLLILCCPTVSPIGGTHARSLLLKFSLLISTSFPPRCRAGRRLSASAQPHNPAHGGRVVTAPSVSI